MANLLKSFLNVCEFSSNLPTTNESCTMGIKICTPTEFMITQQVVQWGLLGIVHILFYKCLVQAKSTSNPVTVKLMP